MLCGSLNYLFDHYVFYFYYINKNETYQRRFYKKSKYYS